MASPDTLQPAEATARALAFLERGVTGSFVPDALITIRARHVFGIQGVRDEKQQERIDGLARAYDEGGARHMGKFLRLHLEDKKDGVEGPLPLPEEAGRVIERFDPLTSSRR